VQLTLKDDLPFIEITVRYGESAVKISDVVIDTGSATTILAADILAQIGIVPAADDILYTVRGVGGTEVVFTRQIDGLQIDAYELKQFEIEVGGMDYGFGVNGILGMDFLIPAGAIINLRQLELHLPKIDNEM